MKFILFFLFTLPFFEAPSIEKDKDRWKPYYLAVEPEKTADRWLLPFDVADRSKTSSIKIISIFGDHRDSYYKGHIHTAIDIKPAKPKNNYIPVYAMAKGVVCSVHLGENQKTVVVRHTLKDGKTMFTSYKHLKEVYVTNGKQVDQNTKLARLFTKEESKRYGGDYHHLHLEIRKKFDDYGCASWLTFNNTQLKERFYNPQDFLKQNIK